MNAKRSTSHRAAIFGPLDRLFRKGALSRFKEGRAFFYRPKGTHDELMSQLGRSALSTMFHRADVARRGSRHRVRPLIPTVTYGGW